VTYPGSLLDLSRIPDPPGISNRGLERLVAERDRYREALQGIEAVAGAAGSGRIAAMPIAGMAREALALPGQSQVSAAESENGSWVFR